MRKFVISVAVILVGLIFAICIFGCQSTNTRANGKTFPTDLTMSPSNMFCDVRVQQIPPQHGEGYLWVKSEVDGHCGDGPKWSIAPAGADIFAWSPANIAYIGGQEGTYVVTAQYNGGSGSLTIQITH